MPDGTPRGLWLGSLVLFIYYHSIRLGACLQLRWSDIDLSTGRVVIRGETQKHGDDQSLMLNEQMLGLLKKFPNCGGDGLVWEWPFHRSMLYIEFKKAATFAGLPTGRRNCFHKLRRTSATMVALHVGRDAVTQHLGHSDPTCDAVYVDTSFLPESNAAEKIPRPEIIDVKPLVKTGKIEPEPEDLSMVEIGVLLDEYIASVLKPVSSTSRGLGMSVARVRFVVFGCGIQTLSDATADRVVGWLDAKRAEYVAEKTLCDYRQAVARFIRWLVRGKRQSGEVQDCLDALDALAFKGRQRKDGGT